MLIKQAPWINGKALQTLFVLYLLSNLLLLLNINGLYWDDWVLYHQSFDEMKDMMNQLTGNAHVFEYLHHALSQIGNGVFPYRLLTTIVYFLSGLFLYYILSDIKSLSRKSGFYITLLFIVLPVNSARVALCDVQYGLFLCVFFMAFWLLTRYVNQIDRSIFFRAAILGLFFLSFFVSSLLVFYAIVILYLFYESNRQATKVLVHYADFICLPVLFYCIKSIYYVPYGLYSHYNAISTDYLVVMLNLAQAVKMAFYKPLVQAFAVSQQFLFLLCVTMAFLFLYLREEPVESQQKKPIILMALGILFFMLAVFPYVAVGKIPALDHFDSRHMLLIPLGLSFFLYSIILFMERLNRAFAHIALITLLSACILKNMHDQTQYLKDWFYQVALEEHYKDNPIINDNTTFLFKSNIAFANHRSMQFYEHNGRLKKVFGDDTRFMGDNVSELQTYASYKNYPRYNFSTWTPSTPVTVIIQKSENHDLTQKPFLNLLISMLHNDTKFRREVKKLITMDVA